MSVVGLHGLVRDQVLSPGIGPGYKGRAGPVPAETDWETIVG